MDLNTYLTEVKMHCNDKGMHPDNPFIVNHFVTKCELSNVRKRLNYLLEVISRVMDTIVDFMKDIPVLVAVTDDVPLILDVWGNPQFVENAKHVGIVPGAILQERYVGSNAPLAALELKKPVSLLGTDHYFTILYELACYSVPIKNLRHEVIASVSLLTPLKFSNPYILGMLLVAQRSIECDMTCRI